MSGLQTMPYISVVIPLYNKALYLTQTINSVLAQSLRDFEVIVIDDGSTDGGPQVVASYSDSRIRLFRQSNKGISYARNRGIAEARSDLIAFLDADDVWHPEHLETLLRLRRRFPQAGICATSWIRLFEGERQDFPKYRFVAPVPWEGILDDYFKCVAFGDSPLSVSGVGVPAKVFTKIGRFKLGLNRAEDTEMWGRIAFSYPVAFSWDGPGYYRKNAVNSVAQMVPMPQEHPFLSSVRDYYGSESQAPYYVRCYLNRKRMERCNNLIRLGKKKEAIKYLFSRSPFPCPIKYIRKTIHNILFK